MLWSEVNIRLPLPLSNNGLVMPSPDGKRLISTPEARAYRLRAVTLLRGYADRFHLEPLTCAVFIRASFFVPSLSSDCNNRWKALEDAMKGIVWVDDRQVGEGLSQKRFARSGEEPYCVVAVERLDDEEINRRLELSARRPKHAPRGERRTLKSIALPAVYR